MTVSGLQLIEHGPLDERAQCSIEPFYGCAKDRRLVQQLPPHTQPLRALPRTHEGDARQLPGWFIRDKFLSTGKDCQLLDQRFTRAPHRDKTICVLAAAYARGEAE